MSHERADQPARVQEVPNRDASASCRLEKSTDCPPSRRRAAGACPNPINPVVGACHGFASYERSHHPAWRGGGDRSRWTSRLVASAGRSGRPAPSPAAAAVDGPFENIRMLYRFPPRQGKPGVLAGFQGGALIGRLSAPSQINEPMRKRERPRAHRQRIHRRQTACYFVCKTWAAVGCGFFKYSCCFSCTCT